MRLKEEAVDDLWDVDDDSDDADSSALDSIFESYYRPDLPDDEQADNEVFLEAVEKENEQVITELEEADKSQRMTNAKSAVNSGVDASYYVSIVFVSEAQKKQFLDAMDWARYGGYRFLNGVKMAEDMGIAIDPAYLATTAREDKKLMNLKRRKQDG